MSVFLIVLASFALVAQLAVAVLLVRKYLRSRNVGFIWLGIAVVVWPLTSALLGQGERVFIQRAISRNFFPFEMMPGSFVALLSMAQQVIGIGLVLVAVIYLCQAKSNSDQATV
jgi:hypothetical protein